MRALTPRPLASACLTARLRLRVRIPIHGFGHRLFHICLAVGRRRRDVIAGAFLDEPRTVIGRLLLGSARKHRRLHHAPEASEGSGHFVGVRIAQPNAQRLEECGADDGEVRGDDAIGGVLRLPAARVEQSGALSTG